MDNNEELKKLEEEMKIKDSELINKYGTNITKLRKRIYCRRSKKNTRKTRKER